MNAFGPDALAGLDAFAHVEIIFLFDQFDEANVTVGSRHQRGNEAWPRVGIFAQRSSSRPNRLGLTTCEVVGVNGLELAVRGLDAIDGSPVLDIKAYITEFEPPGTVVQTREDLRVDGRLLVTDREPQERIVAGTC